MKINGSVANRMTLSGIFVLITCLPSKSQDEEGENLQQYLFPSFTKSLIKTRGGNAVNIILNYNMVSEKMVFEQKGQFYDLLNPEQVDTAYIQNRKFVPHGKEFVEVAVTGSYQFYIQHKADLVAPPRPGAYGTTSELSSSNYLSGYQTDNGYFNLKLPEGYTVKPGTFYWIRKGDEWFKINSEKQVPKLFPGSEDQVKNFIKLNRIKADKTADMIKLGVFLNGLPK